MRKQYPAKEKICIVLDGLRDEEIIAELWQEGVLMLPMLEKLFHT